MADRVTGERQLLGFATLAVITVVTSAVYFFLFSCIRLKHRNFIFASNPDGRVATAPSFAVWFSRVCALRPEDAKTGGIDAWVHTTRTSLHYATGMVLGCVAIPLALCYALSGQESAGFGRVSFANVLRGSEKSRLAWSWVALAGAWLTHLVFLRFLNAADARAHEALFADVNSVPRLDHYVLCVTEIEGDTKDAKVASATQAVVRSLGSEAAVLHVALVPKLSGKVSNSMSDVETGERYEEKKKKGMFDTGPDGLRERCGKYAAALASVAAADKAYNNAKDKDAEPKKGCCGQAAMSETPKERVTRCRTEANEARLKLVNAASPSCAREYTTKAFVIVQDVASACVAIRVDKVRAPWVAVAPEPRDVYWGQFEALPPLATQHHKQMVGTALKAAMFTFWSVVILGLLIGIKFLLSFLSKIGGVVATVCAMAGPIINASLAAFLLDYMAVIIKGTLAPTFDCTWSKSAAEVVTQRDYTAFLLVVGFAMNLLGSALFDVIGDVAGSPFSIFSLLAKAVPVSADFFINFIFFRMSGAISGGSQVVRWVVSVILKKIFPPTNDFAERKLSTPPEPNLAFEASWENFVLVCLLTYTPLAPATAWVCMLYFAVAHFFNKQVMANVARPTFSTAGKLWNLYSSQALLCQAIALLIHVSIFLFSGSWGIFICMLPIVIYTLTVRSTMRERARISLHGPELRGRAILQDARVIDAKHARAAVAVATRVENQSFWSARCAPAAPNADSTLKAATRTALGTQADEADVMSRQIALDNWLNRYDSADFTKLNAGAADGSNEGNNAANLSKIAPGGLS